MEKARLRLINEQPFYALFLNKCRVVWNERVGTAGVRLNRRAEVELHVCRAYFDSMDVKRQVGILIHEMLHVMERHFVRGEGILGTAQSDIGNKAMDIEINPLIDAHLLHETWLIPEMYGLPRGKSFEEYYLELLKQAKDGGGSGKGKPGGQGNGKGGLQGETQDNHDFFANEAVGAVDVNKIVGDMVESAFNETKQRFPGKEPANIEALIRKLREKAKVDWKAETRKFVGRNLSDHAQTTRTRANRRFGLRAMGVKRDYIPKVLILCDHSGSVDDNIELQLISEMSAILKVYGTSKTEVGFFDTEMGVRCKLNAFSEIPPRQKCGGTSFQAAMDYANEVKPDLLIILTDGGDSMPTPPKFPVLWLIAGGSDGSHLKGQVIVI